MGKGFRENIYQGTIRSLVAGGADVARVWVGTGQQCLLVFTWRTRQCFNKGRYDVKFTFWDCSAIKKRKWVVIAQVWRGLSELQEMGNWRWRIWLLPKDEISGLVFLIFILWVWLFCLHVCLCCMFVQCSRRGHWIPWNWSHRTWWSTMWVLGTDIRSFPRARAPSAAEPALQALAWRP